MRKNRLRYDKEGGQGVVSLGRCVKRQKMVVLIKG